MEHQGLGLLRELRAAGVPCALIDQDKWGAARFSRYRCRTFQSPPYDEDVFWPWLVDVNEREKLQDWILIATDDEQVKQISLHLPDASKRFRYAGPTWDQYQLLYDKRSNYEWCLRHGFPAPQSYIPQAREDFPGRSLNYPFIVKPAVKSNFKRYSKAKAILVGAESDLRTLLGGQLAGVDVRELIYQEIIPGGGRQQWSYAGLFLEGEPLAAFTACRQRQHPPDFGRASTYVVAEHDAEVERESRKVIAALKSTGLAEVEWKRDPRNRQSKFLEVNARCWGCPRSPAGSWAICRACFTIILAASNWNPLFRVTGRAGSSTFGRACGRGFVAPGRFVHCGLLKEHGRQCAGLRVASAGPVSFLPAVLVASLLAKPPGLLRDWVQL